MDTIPKVIRKLNPAVCKWCELAPPHITKTVCLECYEERRAEILRMEAQLHQEVTRIMDHFGAIRMEDDNLQWRIAEAIGPIRWDIDQLKQEWVNTRHR